MRKLRPSSEIVDNRSNLGLHKYAYKSEGWALFVCEKAGNLVKVAVGQRWTCSACGNRTCRTLLMLFSPGVRFSVLSCFGTYRQRGSRPGQCHRFVCAPELVTPAGTRGGVCSHSPKRPIPRGPSLRQGIRRRHSVRGRVVGRQNARPDASRQIAYEEQRRSVLNPRTDRECLTAERGGRRHLTRPGLLGVGARRRWQCQDSEE